MYRGRPPPRGGYPPPFEGRGPRPAFREDRSRPRPPFQSYHDSHSPDTYRRSPPRRRYSSPGSGSHRGPGGEYWGSGSSRARSPCSGIPSDHSLVITVGNEFTGLPSRDYHSYPKRPSYDSLDDRGPRRRSPSRGRSRPRSRSPEFSGRSKSRLHSRSPEFSGRSKSRLHSRSPEFSGRSKSRLHSRSPEFSGRSKSRLHSRSPEFSGRSKSRPRSRSPVMGGRSKSRARSRSPEMEGRSKSRARSRSPAMRGRSKSRARSRSFEMQGRSKSRAQSRSPEMGGRGGSRARSRSTEKRGRSKSRGMSKSRLSSRSRSRSGSRCRSYTHKSRSRSVSTSSTSSSRSSSSVGGSNELKKSSGLKELELARRRKEMEDMLNMPTKSILKRRIDSDTDSPSFVQNSDSPRVVPACEAEAERLLSAMKGMDPNMLATMLGELRDDPNMAPGRLDHSGIAGILGLLGGASALQDEKRKKLPDIEDEEKFLYGDEDDLERGQTLAKSPHQHSRSDLYGDVISEPAHFGSSSQLESPPVNVEPRSSRQQQVDMRYPQQSRSSVPPDQKPEGLNDYPPGTGPLEGKEKQDVEEYEKIQDLLKTIGLDLGVTEISKMAARTQERLHGKRPPPKTPTHRPGKRRVHRDSSGSSHRGRSRSRTSSSSGSSGSWSGSQSSSQENSISQKKSLERHSTHTKARGGRELKTEDDSWGKTVSQIPEPSPVPPTHPSISMPAYSQAQAHALVPSNYPPPGYGQYGNWSYMPHQWPMYPPPSMGMPAQPPVEDFPNSPQFDRPFLRVIQTDLHKSGDSKASSKLVSQDNGKDRRVLEEINNESQKQKVLEEREKLRKDRDIRMKKKDYLMKELERLRKQQGELLRKKRREKDGHKDPLLSEISRLQEEVMSQIGELRKEHEVSEKKRSELDKVALILGLQPTDKPRREGRASVDHEQTTRPPPPENQKKRKHPEKSPVVQASAKVTSSSRTFPEKLKKIPASTQPPETPADPFNYYDAGHHWCKSCNVTCGSMFDFFTHLHSKSHRKTLDPYSRPWASSSPSNEKNKILPSGERMSKPAKGSEFLVPVRGYYCQLCEQFYGDAICAEDHAVSHAHNEKYQKRMYEYPLYEQRRNLDRQAGLTLEVSDKKQSELKRKHDEEESKKSKEIDEGKHKHSKKDKEEDRKAKHRKEEEEKAKQKEEEEKARKMEEEEQAKRIKEKYKFNKREELERRNKHIREGGGRPKYSKKEEVELYKNHREEEEKQKHHREDADRCRSSRLDERPKFSGRDHDEDDEGPSRYGKWKKQSPKYNDKEERYRSEREEAKYKNEKEGRQFRQDKGGLQKDDDDNDKSGTRKHCEPEKATEPPKVFCGPNPALRAKLRKKSEETAKVEQRAQPAFGKFSWKKKRENELAKEAERVAAEFLKEDEAVAEEDDDPDAFSKSVAAAKSIAIKLSGKTVIPPTNSWVPFNSGKIRPNLPAPSVVLRKASGLGPWVYAAPTPLNTFLSIRPPGASVVTPLPVVPNQAKKDLVLAPDVISKAFCGEEVDLKTTADDIGMPDSTSNPDGDADGIVNEFPTSTPEENKASTTGSVSQAHTSSPSAVMLEFKTPLPPPPALTTMNSDVSAPGVPESEQNVPVMVTPPPFMQRPTSEVMNKSDKPKSSLAAANAQDLFDIFYSSSNTASSTYTISSTTSPKAVIESRSEPNVSKNIEVFDSMSPQIQPKLSAHDSPNFQLVTQEIGSHLQRVVPTPVINKSAKPKSSLAAGNAQDLFDLFYSSSNTVSTKSAKAVVESRSERNVLVNNIALDSMSPQTQPKLSAHDNSHTVESDIQELMESEIRSDLQPVVPTEVMNKSEKPKSSLAAGNAQDLFDIFYSSRNTASTTSTISRTTSTNPVVESKSERNVSRKNKAFVSMSPQTKPKVSAHDSSNTIETDTRESRETSGPVKQPKDVTAENALAQLKNKLLALDNNNAIGTDTQESIESKSGSYMQPKEKIAKEILENAPVQLDNQHPTLANSNAVETHTPKAIDTGALPNEETPEEPSDAPLKLDNPSDTLGISTETLDLPTEVLGLDLFDFNFE